MSILISVQGETPRVVSTVHSYTDLELYIQNEFNVSKGGFQIYFKDQKEVC